MSGDEEAFAWFWYEKEMSEDDEGKENDIDDASVFSRRCSKCGSKLKWDKHENRLVCPKCRI